MKINVYRKYFFISVFLIVSGGCFKSLTHSDIVYFNDFESGKLNGFQLPNSSGPVIVPPIETFNGSKVFGRFNNTPILLKLDSLPLHNAVEVSFDLYIHDKWEGDHIGYSGIPDLWAMRINDSLQFYTTFSNTQYTQTYPNMSIGYASYPARANSWISNLPGVCLYAGKADGSSYYKFVQTFVTSKSSFSIQLSDALQGDKCTKSWSVDNFQVRAILY